MKEIIALVQAKKQEFSKLPFFEYLRNSNIDPREKLVFAPVVSPLAMGFGELCRDVFREEPTTDPVQLLINKHTYEEHYHWVWLLEDMEKLGLNPSMPFSDSLKWIWSEKTKKNRFVCTQFERYSYKADPILKLVVIWVAEVTGNVFFEATEQVVQNLKQYTDQEYRYFGMCHFDQELNHNLNKHEVVQFLAGIKLTEEKKQKAIEIVEELFAAFTGAVDEYMTYIETNTPQTKQLSTV